MTADAMSHFVVRCALLTEADGAMILLSGDDGELTVWAAAGPLADVDAGPGATAVGDAQDSWIAAIRGAVGVRRCVDFPNPKDADLARVWLRADSLLIAPIPARGGGHGADGVVICLRSVGRPAFESELEPELVSLAEQASFALEVVGRAEQRGLAELMADRERIARDLHDQVIQRLFAVGLSLQGQLRHITDPTTADRVDHAIGEIDEAITDLRSSIFDLRAAADARTSLRRRLAAIISGANGTAGAIGIAGAAGANGAIGVDGAARRVTLRCRGPIDTMILPELAGEVEAVVREAVSNAVKHSGATKVAVTVTSADALHVTVTDNGCGIPPNVVRSGLKNISERAKSCGGELHVDSVIRDFDTDPCAVTGTTLRWTVPL